MIDYTRLLGKLQPEKDGESPVYLRTMTVAAVNGDGSVNLTTSGVTITNVGRLSSATVSVGNQVQVLVGRGVALVLGTVA